MSSDPLPSTRRTPPYPPPDWDEPYAHTFDQPAPTSASIPPPAGASSQGRAGRAVAPTLPPPPMGRTTPCETVSPFILSVADRHNLPAAIFVAGLPGGELDPRAAIVGLKGLAEGLPFTSDRATLTEGCPLLSEAEREALGRILNLAALALRG